MTKPTAPLDALRALMKAVERCEDNDYSATSRAALAAAADSATALTAVSPAPTFQAHCRVWSGPLMAPEDAMHRLQQIANHIDRVITECRTLHNDDCTALQAAWSVVNGVVRNIDDEVHSRGLG